MSESEDQDKQHDPTQKKLDDARKKGEVPRSVDLTTAATYGGFLICAFTFGAASIVSLGSALSGILEQAGPLAEGVFSGHQQSVIGGLIMIVIGATSPWFLFPALAAILSVVAQKSFLVTPDKIQLKLNRISLLSNAKNKFGRNGLFEFAKSFFKLLIYSIVLGIFLLYSTPEILGSLYLEPTMVTSVLAQMCLSFLVIVLVVSGLVGVVDFVWQSAEHVRKNRMSRKELTDESKQSEGDPHMKQQRRQKGYEIAMNQMLAQIPASDVVIVNPQHYAVVLKWSRKAGAAPVCVAKGVDGIAARIREIASESAVPIHRDPPTARALYSAVEIGDEIHPDHYKAVAAAIRFAEAMTKKAGVSGWQK